MLNSSKQNHYLFLTVMIMMSASGLFATDIYLPALPQMLIDFNCTQQEIQVSFTVFLLGLAACQMITGILADNFGRKKVAIIALTLFIFASFLCAFSKTLEQFLLCRLFQALGCGAGSVISRVIISSRFNRKDAIKIFSTIFPIIGLSSAVAPFIGGFITYFWAWRVTFIFMAFFGLTVLSFVIFFLKEETPGETSEGDQKENRAWGYFGIFKNLEYLGYILLVCSGFCVFRSYTVESPFVFDNQGYAVEEIGQFYIALSIAYIVGNLMAKQLVKHRKVEDVFKVGLLWFALGGIMMILSAFLIQDNAYAVIIPMSIITIGNGCLFPTGSASALASVPRQYVGTASGFMGMLQLILASLCINSIGSICQGQFLKMSFFIGAIIFFAILSYFLLITFRSKIRAETV